MTTPPQSSLSSRRPTASRLLRALPLTLGIIILAGLVYLSMTTGTYNIAEHEGGEFMYFATRIPRTASLVLAGAAMAMCGLVMQLLTQNKFVEPTTTGTTEWAGLGLLVVMFLVPHTSLIEQMLAAILFAFIGTIIFFLVLRRVTLRSSVIVPIVGIMLGAVVSAISTFFALKTDTLQTLGVWFQGSFANVVAGRYEPLWIVLIATVLIFILADRLTVAGLGEDVATGLGVNYNLIVLLGTGVIALTTGVVTVVIGRIPFLGLIVPNFISLLRGDDLRSNLPWVCVFGAGILTVCDLVSRTLIAPFEIPVSLILGTLGAAVFIFLILRQRRRLS